MKQEITWLTYTLVMTGLFWVPYVLNRMKEAGIWTAIGKPNADTTPTAPWARRMMAAHKNAVENLVIFAPLVLALQAMGISNSMTTGACMWYFYCRLVHFIVYSAGVPVLRTVAFVGGFMCQGVLAYNLLQAL